MIAGCAGRRLGALLILTLLAATAMDGCSLAHGRATDRATSPRMVDQARAALEASASLGFDFSASLTDSSTKLNGQPLSFLFRGTGATAAQGAGLNGELLFVDSTSPAVHVVYSGNQVFLSETGSGQWSTAPCVEPNPLAPIDPEAVLAALKWSGRVVGLSHGWVALAVDAPSLARQLAPEDSWFAQIVAQAGDQGVSLEVKLVSGRISELRWRVHDGGLQVRTVVGPLLEASVAQVSLQVPSSYRITAPSKLVLPLPPTPAAS